MKQNPEELARIQQASSRRIDQQGINERCTIVLSGMRSKTICELSRLTSKSRQFIRRWLSRYIEHGVNGLRDRPRSGRPSSLSTDSIEEIKGLCFTSPDYIKSLDEFDHAREELRYHVFFGSKVQHHAVKNLNHELIELNRAVTRGKRLTERQKGLLKKYSDYDVSKHVEGMADTSPVYLSSRM